MMTLIFAVLLLVIMLLSGMLARFYTMTPINELRRQARKGNKRASILHEVVRNAGLAKAYLLLISLICFAILVTIVASKFDFLVATLIIMLVVGAWYASLTRSRYIEPVAVKIAPNFALIIVASRPYVSYLRRIFNIIVPANNQTQVFEKDDLVNLLKRQQGASNNRIDKAELDFAMHALTFGEKLVKDFMTPRKVVRFVRTDEPISTVLMSELHDSGFSRFPVYMDDNDNIVGTLYLKDLVERRMSGKVFSAMSSEFYDVLETETLEEVLQKFLKTMHHLFIVRNEFGEVIGIITIEDVIEQMIGRKIVDESDNHEDMRDFAKESAKQDKTTV